MELSEEEKEAIESVKSMFGDITIEKLIKDKIFNITICSLGILDILRVIAIVGNLQKEIEEKTTILLAGAEKVKQLEKGNRSLMESRIKWKNRYYKEKEKEQNLIFQLKDEEKELIKVTQNIISKDKIMAKIEELEKKAEEMKYDYDVSYAEEDLFNKNVKFFKEQMQELLEEPKLLEENK